jgi:hypothetical protein
VTEQPTNPAGESGPRTDWDIGKSLNAFFEAPADEQDIEAEAIPDEGKIADDDEQEETEASGDEDAVPEDEEPSDEPFLIATVNGKAIPVGSKEEAIPLVQKGLHYTQEMQKLRERETQLVSREQQIDQQLSQHVGQYQTALKQIHDTYGVVLGKQAPDWSSDEMQKLKAEKPQEYLQIREQWDQLGTIRSELSRIEAEQQEKQQKQYQAWLSEQQALLAEKRPEWTDAARRTQDFSLIQGYATSQGLTEQEIGNLFDHRFWMILHDAARYRQAETAGKKKVAEKGPRTAQPGTGRNVNQGDRHLRQVRETLRTTGDDRAAGILLQERMTRRGK